MRPAGACRPGGSLGFVFFPPRHRRTVRKGVCVRGAAALRLHPALYVTRSPRSVRRRPLTGSLPHGLGRLSCQGREWGTQRPPRKREGRRPPPARPANPGPRAAFSVCRSPICPPSSSLSVNPRWPFPDASKQGTARAFRVLARPPPGARPPHSLRPAPPPASRPGLALHPVATSCVGGISRTPGCGSLGERPESRLPSRPGCARLSSTWRIRGVGDSRSSCYLRLGSPSPR